MLPVFQSTFPRGKRPNSKPFNKSSTGFNPRSREGNDMVSPDTLARLLSFNPRSREGNDRTAKIRRHYFAVSIHVPARETTICCFNLPSVIMFQSTFPRGKRPLLLCTLASHAPCFNPRSREGNDLNQSFQTLAYMLFQSTFPRGKRLYDLCLFC